MVSREETTLEGFLQSGEDSEVENWIYKKFGLKKQKGQSREEYLHYMHRVVNKKEKPLSWITGPINELFFGKYKEANIDNERLQRITEEYYGVETEPVDFFVQETSMLKVNGWALGEPDGSGVVVASSKNLEHNYNEDLREFVEDLRVYHSNSEKIEEREKDGMSKLLKKEFRGKPEEIMFKNWLSSVYKNFDYVVAHEGAHNLHHNNRPQDVKKTIDYALSPIRSVLGKIPILRYWNNFGIIKKSVDSESLAFKVSTDAYIEKTFNEVRENEGENEFSELESLEDQFYDMSSRFAKKIIKGPYLDKHKLYNMKKAALKVAVAATMYNIFDQDSVDGFWSGLGQGIAYLNLAKAWTILGGSLVREPVRTYFTNKTNQYVDAWNTITKHHGIKRGIQEAIAMDADERVKYAKSL